MPRFKATEVKFGAGQKLDVKRPMRVLEIGSGDDKKLDRKKLIVDSDKAISTATKEPLLQNLKLTATQLWLQRGEDGPVWRVRLWAVKLRNPNADVDIGDVYISAVGWQSGSQRSAHRPRGLRIGGYCQHGCHAPHRE